MKKLLESVEDKYAQALEEKAKLQEIEAELRTTLEVP
jgi:hypothetical protein